MDVLNDIKERLEFLKEMGVMELRVNLAPQVKAEFVASKDAPLSERVRECKKCALSSERINAVPGAGGAGRGIMFVSIMPAEEEDRDARLFSGKGGELLLLIITGAFKMTRDDVYVTNVVKCRGKGGRFPSAEEISQCLPYLQEEINVVSPKVIITLGDGAINALLNRPPKADEGVAGLRGKFYSYKGIKITPIYHPMELLEKPSLKREAHEDIKMVVSELNLKGRHQ
ncbi:MAG: uracil-DNA glycosylase [Deltaproteobacteria bacterium]